MAKSGKNIKKAFFEVVAPLTSAKVSIYGESAEALVGRVVTLDLTRSLKGKSLELKFRVKNGENGLIGEPMSLVLAGSYIRRMIRKGIDYVEDSFKSDCKDSKVEAKIFIITRNKVSRAVRNHIRVEARKIVESYLKGRTTKEVFSEITANKIQREMSLKLKKIYPLALCEINSFKLVSDAVASTAAGQTAALDVASAK